MKTKDKSLILLVEPSGIEPLTSTLPVFKDHKTNYLYSAYTVVFALVSALFDAINADCYRFLVAFRCGFFDSLKGCVGLWLSKMDLWIQVHTPWNSLNRTISARSKLMALLLLALVGCSEHSQDTVTEWTVICDSLGEYVYPVEDPSAQSPTAWPNLLGLQSECVPGRPIWAVLPEEYSMPTGNIILSLGTANYLWETPIDTFTMIYQQVLDTIDGDVICILPQGEEYANAVRGLCSTVVEPPKPDYIDGIHGMQGYHDEMARRLDFL